ncbi:9969_t:CDS:2 [Funneliformis caledonium]|uniref:9969_t:CDS:1 n=1 Tax=Funneliformis caledonium TaxID=1117310 RepID=A0A9N9AXW7_9GLOM|nr:9969_t:CDS:2 [Funneliformis caledonium]
MSHFSALVRKQILNSSLMLWHEQLEVIKKALEKSLKIIDNGSYILDKSNFIKFITLDTLLINHSL